MKIAFYLNVLSPHQLPLAREVAKIVGAENFKYVYAEDFLADRKTMGWDDGDVPAWCVKGDEDAPELVDADLVYTGIRCVGLMAKRSAMGKLTAYYSERWFKPIAVMGCLLPGWLRLLSPRYRKMARQMVQLLNNPTMRYLPCGPWAAKDIMKIGLRNEQILPWGYFVAPGRFPQGRRITGGRLRVLWVGRFLDWKRVDTIIESVGKCFNHKDISLDIYGIGPEEMCLKNMALECGRIITIRPSVPIEDVRELMIAHDVYVLASNEYEGWGAVVNEALEEGMYVIGTKESGAGAAILPEDAKFSCGDWKRLSQLLKSCAEKKKRGVLKGQGIGEWSAENAARRLINLFEQRK